MFAKVNVSQLALALKKNNCEILSLHERDESLESFYMNLVGGSSRKEGV